MPAEAGYVAGEKTMAQKNNVPVQKKSYFLTLLVVILLAAAAALLFPRYRELRKAETERAAAKQQEEQKKRQIVELRQENEALRSSPDAVEKVAREKFNLCKPGETVMKYDKPTQDTPRR